MMLAHPVTPSSVGVATQSAGTGVGMLDGTGVGVGVADGTSVGVLDGAEVGVLEVGDFGTLPLPPLHAVNPSINATP